MKTDFLISVVFLLSLCANIFSQESSTNADADYYISGERIDSQAGYSICNAGDVNGDGIDDFLIGAPFDPENGVESGNAYLFFGSRKGWKDNIDDADVKFYSGNDFNRFGWKVCSAGDVNGDRLNDFLISGFNASGINDLRGATFLYLGRNRWNKEMFYDDADASFIGEQPYDRSGFSLAGGGDINSDGFDDFIIGAYSANRKGLFFTGCAYIFFGTMEGFSLNTPLSEADVIIPGIFAGGNFSFSMDIIGDVNGDNFDEILISSPLASIDEKTGNGIAYLITGRFYWQAELNLNSSHPSFIGEANNSNIGKIVSSAGDINGDGLDDFIIGGSSVSDDSTQSEGGAFLFLGRNSLYPPFTKTRDADIIFQPDSLNSSGSMTFAKCGDISGDSLDDLLIGMPDIDIVNKGNVHFFSGRKFTKKSVVTISETILLYKGKSNGEYAGWDIVTGDFNGNGKTDILISAPKNNDNVRAGGRVYIFLDRQMK